MNRALREFLKNRGPETGLGWVCTIAAGASWVYAAALVLAFSFHWRSDQWLSLADWVALPVQFLALLLVVIVVYRDRFAPNATRSGWWCVLAFTAISPLATFVWNMVPRDSHPERLGLGDFIYFADYWALTAAFAVLFVRAGGTFRALRTWLDALTMTAVQLVAVWAFFLGPSVVNGATFDISLATTLAYSVTLACMMTTGALLCLQLPRIDGNVSTVLLVGAGLVTAAWEIMWLASWLTDRDFVGPFYNFGDVLSFAAVSSAAAAKQFRPAPAAPVEGAEGGRTENFPAALSVLVAIAIIAGSIATTRRWDAWILVALVVLCAALLVTRQRRERKELRLLNRQLAQHAADARLTELVRRSTDLILLVSADDRVSFASPVTESMLGIPAEQLLNAHVVDLLGPDNSSAVSAVVDQAKLQPATSVTVELQVVRADVNRRVIRINASNQLANAFINGIVLTLTDITDQRMLEREVLDIASRERMRLSAAVHDDLGQRLFGVSMLLHGAVTSPHADPAVQNSQLKVIVEHINEAVIAARELAQGLSPLQVARGSLGSALRRLAWESTASAAVNLRIDPAFDEDLIDDFCAEHLYRIAQEAMVNSLRHSACTCIDISLRHTPVTIELAITDDGRGFDPSAAFAGLGLRIMGYRARIVGGTLRVTSAGGTGSRVEVTAPIDRESRTRV